MPPLYVLHCTALTVHRSLAAHVAQIIVIGAGLSGLGCAWELRAHGIDVLVLEGKPEVGGRVYTDHNGMDLGAHWIHGGGERGKCTTAGLLL